MKTVIPGMWVFYLLLCQTCFAQTKRHVTIGTDFVRYAYPRQWTGKKEIDKVDYLKTNLNFINNFSFWVDYRVRNVSFQAYYSSIYQVAEYRPNSITPYNFFYYRSARFYDVMAGYNFVSLFQKENMLYGLFDDKTSITAYCGISMVCDGLVSNEFYDWSRYNWATNQNGILLDINRLYYDYIFRPVFKVQYLYNFLSCFVIGLSGTYHHIGKNFKPVSGNISLGVQF